MKGEHIVVKPDREVSKFPYECIFHQNDSSHTSPPACVATIVIGPGAPPTLKGHLICPIRINLLPSPPMGTRRDVLTHIVPCGKFTGSGAKFQPSANPSQSARRCPICTRKQNCGLLLLRMRQPNTLFGIAKSSAQIEEEQGLFPLNY